MTHDSSSQGTASYDCDVVIVGGGPAGCSAGIFAARAGLDTLVFDRGRSSIRRCAYLENYPGFPAGVDVETFCELLHEHAETAGCAIVPDLVESVDRLDGETRNSGEAGAENGPETAAGPKTVSRPETEDEPVSGGPGFVVRPQAGDPVTARRVIAATRYDGEYLRGIDDDAALFETYEYDGEEREYFDRGYPDADGTTPIEGLYVASPAEEADRQVVMAAGRGARVAHRAIADARLDDGWWEAAVEGVDWVRREADLDDERADRETLIERFDDAHAAAAPVDPDSERYRRVREAYVDERLSAYVCGEEIAARAERGHATLAAHLDPGAVLDALDEESFLEMLDAETLVDAVDEGALLDALDDETIRAYADGDSRRPGPEER